MSLSSERALCCAQQKESFLISFSVASPLKLCRSIDLKGWLLLLSGWLAWTVDGYDVSHLSQMQSTCFAQLNCGRHGLNPSNSTLVSV